MSSITSSDKGTVIDAKFTVTISDDFVMVFGTIPQRYSAGGGGDDRKLAILPRQQKNTFVEPQYSAGQAVRVELHDDDIVVPAPWDEFIGMFKDDPDAIEVEKTIAKNKSKWRIR